MKYMGSKRGIAKYILPIMLKERKDNQLWVEPFVGGGNMIDKITGERLGFDKNPNTIMALQAVQKYSTELPKNNIEFTKLDYLEAKKIYDKNIEYIDTKEAFLSAFAGFTYSFGGQWFKGWASSFEGRDYVAESYRNAIKQSPLLAGVNLSVKDYKDIQLDTSSIIYCDPPYSQTTKYKVGDFNTDEFFDWCRLKKKEGHTIFISEYKAPSDFKCVWEKQVRTTLAKSNDKNYRTEKLFTL